MTKEQVKLVVQQYQQKLKTEGYAASQIDFDRTTRDLPKSRQLEHCSWMCGEILTSVDTDIEKAMRWLGFVQGVLWVHGIYAVNEMREQNRARAT